MYLSRLVLDPRGREVRRDLANPRELHRTILSAFPPDPKPTAFRKKHSVLFRTEIDRCIGTPTVLVQSATEPDWAVLEERARYLAEAPAHKNVERAYDHLTDGQTLTFRLRANVTLCTKRNADGTTGKPRRVPLRTPEECTAWLRRKGEQHGFELVSTEASSEVPDLRVNPEQDVDARCGELKRTMRFGSVLFEGRLRITDAGLFRTALGDGIGRGKAYGFGLLSVRPA